ncbi:MAG: DNA-3-methyladenine glycosylase I [Myxococcota bacterium]
MEKLSSIYARAAKRHGGRRALEARLPRVKSRAALRKLPDDRLLAAMTRCVFQAGFVWKVIEAKWEGFEEAFEGFDPRKVSRLSDAAIGKLRSDTRIVRNPLKIRAARENAAWLVKLARDHGSAARWLADWPEDDVVVGLWGELGTHGSRLGGRTGPLVLRQIGKDTPMLSTDVVAALRRQGIITSKSPTSKGALASVQDAFNIWRKQSGRSLAEISRILACSEGSVYQGPPR